MQIEIKQSSQQPKATSRWKWSVWLEGPGGELDRIEWVEYELHSTFREPIRRVDDRSTGFRLEATGWGEFMLYATLYCVDKKTERLEHWLRLESDSSESGAPSRGVEETPSVTRTKTEQATAFLSFGLADYDRAQHLTKALEERGVRVVSNATVQLGRDWRLQVQSMLDSADFGVALVSEQDNPRGDEEVEQLMRQKTPVIPVMLGDLPSPPQWTRDLKSLRVDTHSGDADADDVADQLINLAPRLGRG